jgi:peptidoglycan/LPS O-acetylase OafA/YrhL
MSTSSGFAKPQERLAALDGLRGVAALLVVFHHFCCAFLPQYAAALTDHTSWLVDTPLGIFVNGPFSVSIFFVLSGFVVARAAAKSRDPFYVNLPLRYLRLALPATASVILAWGLLTLMPTAAMHLNELRPSPWLSPPAVLQQQIPDVFHALYHGFVEIFKTGDSGFNNVLWTMQIEAVGSMAIYLFYSVKNSRARKVIAILTGMAMLLYPNYLCFVLGALMMEQWSVGRLKYGSPIAALFAGILLGFPAPGFERRLHIPYLWHTHGALAIGEKSSLIAPLAAALILYAVLNLAPLQRMLSSRVPKYLGRVSFPLYLFHVPLLYTIFSVVYVWVKPSSSLFLLPLFAAFLGCSFALASAGEAWIDKPVLDGIGRTRKKLRAWREQKNELKPA